MQTSAMSEIGQELPGRAQRSRRALEGGAHEAAKGKTAWLLAGLGVGSVVASLLLRQSTRAHGTQAKSFRLAGAATAGATLLDALVLVLKRTGGTTARAVDVKTSVTIRRSADDLYRYWRDLRNLPSFMRHVDTVSEIDGHSVWRARGAGGMKAEWEAEIVADRPGERIAWRSLEGASLPNRGSVEFRVAPRERGTEVHLELSFEPPGGAVGAALLRLFAMVSEQSIKNDLRRLKQLMETGEIVCSDASIHRGIHPAQPPTPEQTPLEHGMVPS